MSEAKGRLQIVTDPASGWCDPVTGVCHIVPDDEAATAEARAEHPTGDRPDAAS